jgi:hypothetical protein
MRLIASIGLKYLVSWRSTFFANQCLYHPKIHYFLALSCHPIFNPAPIASFVYTIPFFALSHLCLCHPLFALLPHLFTLSPFSPCCVIFVYTISLYLFMLHSPDSSSSLSHFHIYKEEFCSIYKRRYFIGWQVARSSIY